MLRDEPHSNRGVPEMVLAQREFIQKEKEYFESEVQGFALLCVIVFLVFIGGVTIWKATHA
jgi:hypothetical protein